MKYEEIQEALQDRVLKVVSERTGLSEPTLQKIKAGRTKTPHKSVLRVLSDYLENPNWSITDKQGD